MHIQMAKAMLNWLYYKIVNYLFVPEQKKSIKFWETFMAAQSDNIFSQNKCTFPLNSFRKTAHGPNTFRASAW